MSSLIVSSADRFLVTEGARPVDYCQNGNLWAVIFDNTADEVEFYFSTDGGDSWAQSTASSIGAGEVQAGGLAFFIDQDDYAHLIYSTTDPTFLYRLGTPNAGRTEWSWSSPITLAAQIGDIATIVAHREGSGWKAHALALPTIGGTKHLVRYQIDITSGHVPSLETTVDIHDFGIASGTAGVSVDFRHTQEDPKAVQSSTPSLYVLSWVGSSALIYRKLAYSGGSWGSGTGRTIDGGAQDASSRPYLYYDGTRIVMTHVTSATSTVARCKERDEADTTTTNRDPTALSDGIVFYLSCGYGPNQDIYLTAQGETSSDFKRIIYNRGSGTWGSWSVIHADTVSGGRSALMTGIKQVLGAVIESDASGEIRFAKLAATWQLEADLVGVGDITANLGIKQQIAADLVGVGTLDANLNQDHALGADLTGVGRISAMLEGTPSLDFTVYDLYIDDGTNVTGYLVHEDEQTKGSDSANPIRAEKQDVGQNPSEQRPEFGDHFAQGDFSHGADQSYFHHAGRDERKFLASEGFDIATPGHLHHLHDVLEALDGTGIGALTQANDVVFVAEGNDVRVGNGLFPGSWANEDPHNAEGDTAVLDLTSRGDEVFAALGANGVHIRSSAGVWDHFQPDGATDLSGVGSVTKVEWVKDRLIIAGDGGRGAYEVVADSTPAVMKTLPEGWTFEKFFEAGAFIYGCAVNADAGLSRVHIFGLNSAGTALEDKGSVPIPRGELIYTGIGDPGGIFLGGGRRNSSAGGYDPIFYQAIQSENGFLQLLKIAQGHDVGANDCSVLAFETLGDAIVMSWSLGTGALTGARTGIAWYHLGRQAFVHHLKKDAASTAQVSDILFYRGRILFSIEGDGLYYEDLDNYVAQAELITSVADWGSAGQKIWDQIEIAHHHMPSGGSVRVEYTTAHPEEDAWNPWITSNVAGSLGADGRLSRVESRLFAIKLISLATPSASDAPHLSSFSVRSNPTRSEPEYVLSRFLRLLAKDRKDKRGPVVYQDPVAARIALQMLLDSWVVVYEPGITWTAFVRSVSTTEPAEPFLSGTSGEPLKEAYLIRLDMIATGSAA